MLQSKFKTLGHAGAIPLLSSEEMHECSIKLTPFLDKHKQAQEWYSQVDPINGAKGAVETLYDAHLKDPTIKELCLNRKLIELVTEIMGEDLVIWRTTFWVKQAGARRVEWHQDTYKEEQLGSFPNINAWIAFDETCEENCLWFTEGTHQEIIDLNLFKSIDYVNHLISSDQLPHPPVNPMNSITKVPLNAGECVIFDGRTLHGSPPNLTEKRRAGLVVRFIPKSYELSRYNGPLMDATTGEITGS